MLGGTLVLGAGGTEVPCVRSVKVSVSVELTRFCWGTPVLGRFRVLKVPGWEGDRGLRVCSLLSPRVVGAVRCMVSSGLDVYTSTFLSARRCHELEELLEPESARQFELVDLTRSVHHGLHSLCPCETSRESGLPGRGVVKLEHNPEWRFRRIQAAA